MKKPHTLLPRYGSDATIAIYGIIEYHGIHGGAAPTVTFDESMKNHWTNDPNMALATFQVHDAGSGIGGFDQYWDPIKAGLGSFPGHNGGYFTFSYISDDNQRQGWHTAIVHAYDTSHNNAADYTSGPYGFDSHAPTVTITSGQTNGSTYTNQQHVTWHIDDAGIGIDQWGQAWDSDPSKTYNTSDGYLDLPPGTHTLHVHTWDILGNNKDWTFGPFTYNADSTPPLAAFTSVQNGDSVFGFFHCGGTLSDPGPNASGVAQVRFFVDGVDYGDCATDFTSYFDHALETANLSPGAHTISVHVADNSGNSASYSIQIVTGSAAPVLSATAGSGLIALTWSPVVTATSYSIYRGTSAGSESSTPIATGVNTTSFTDTGLANGTRYYYQVTAVNEGGSGDQSLRSNEASGTPQAGATIPATPAGLTATPGNTQVALSWNASTGATSYTVKRSTASGGPYTTISNPTNTGYTSTGLTNGTTYYFVVSATNSAGTSGNSGQASATPHNTAITDPNGDFNGDGMADVVLQNTAGNQVALWYLNGPALIGGQYVSLTPSSGWRVVSEGDFNGDGKPDLVLQNTTSNIIAVWYLNGAAVVGGAYISVTPGVGWKVVGSGDFDGDGNRDLVLQNTQSNQIVLWFFHGVTLTGYTYLSQIPSSGWKVVAAGDFNGDGKSDLVLQNGTTNQVAVWYVNGVAVTGGAYVSTTPPAGWAAVGAGDFNGDGKRDLVLQNAATSQIALWYLNGVALSGGNYVSSTPIGWKVVGPR